MVVDICQSLDSLKKNVLAKFSGLTSTDMLVFHKDVASAQAFPNGYYKYVSKMRDLSCLHMGDEIYIYPSGEEDQATYDLMLPCKCRLCLGYLFPAGDPRAVPDPNHGPCKLGRIDKEQCTNKE